MPKFRFTAAVVAILSIATIAFAQGLPEAPESQNPSGTGAGALGRHNPDDMAPAAELARLAKELDLTPEQQKQIMPFLVEHQDKFKALFADKTIKPADRHSMGVAISDETHRQIETVLTPEQVVKVRAMQVQMHQADGTAAPLAAPSAHP